MGNIRSDSVAKQSYGMQRLPEYTRTHEKPRDKVSRELGELRTSLKGIIDGRNDKSFLKLSDADKLAKFAARAEGKTTGSGEVASHEASHPATHSEQTPAKHDLPDGWGAASHTDGRTFYYQIGSDVSQWEKPNTGG